MKKIKNQILKLKISPRKELIKLLSINGLFLIAGILISFIMKSWLYIGISVGVGAIFSYLFLSRYSSILIKINQENTDEFVTLFSYFRIYIRNGFNVYTSLKEITYFANENLKEMLDKLINQIDEDKSVKPFIDFAHNFEDIVVEEMMISIYQIIDDGEKNNYLNQFELIFDKFSDLLAQKNLRKKDSSLGMLSSAPLVGSCFLIVAITVGIIGVLGELMNVV